MVIVDDEIISGFIGEAISRCVDFSWTKIKEVVRNRKNKHQSIESQIYNVVVNVLNQITYNKFENDQDKIYQAAEKLLIGYKDSRSDSIEVVRAGLQILGENVDSDKYIEFKNLLYQELSKDDYEELYRQIRLFQQDEESNKASRIEQKIDKVQQSADETNRRLDVFQENNRGKDNIQNKKPVKSRTQEYADKWEANMFLNDFDKRDKKAGTNVKLREVYLEEHLPHYIWKDNEDEEPLSDLKELLSEYINEKRDNKMLLILGQPGIGKSTLITWITANLCERIDDILVYRFASDIRNVDWKGERISSRVLEELGLSHSDLNGKTLIIDGFDEVSIESNRRRYILDSLYGDWIYNKIIENFLLIITCRENYVPQFAVFKCKYITLQPWDEIQMRSFCTVFQEKAKKIISQNTIENLIANKEILGIPLILYMTLALDISIEKEGSIVDIYDKIFSLDGGIYDRCINNKMFGDKHRISVIKNQIHQISREIAIWMFENEANKASIPQEEYQKICRNIIQDTNKSKEIEQDFLIGNFFKLVKHCEGIETEKLYFVHRTIYEYFVAETIYRSIENAMIELSIASQEELARNIAIYLKQGCVNYFIAEYLQYKILKLYSKLNEEKQKRFYQWWENAVYLMMENGMFYYTEKGVSFFKNIIAAECRCFLNLLEILRLLMCIDNRKYIMENAKGELVEKYIKCCCIEYKRFSNDKIMDLSKMSLQKVNLKGIQLKGICLNQVNLERTDLVNVDLSKLALLKADLAYADLRGANLEDAALMEADLRGADLTRANLYGAKLDAAKLVGADLKKADLRGIDLTGAYIEEVYLNGALMDDYQVLHFEKKLNLHDVKIFINKTKEIVNYDEYCESKE